MKHFVLVTVTLCAAVSAQNRFQQEALLIRGDDLSRVWVGDADDKQFLYYETEQGVDSKTMRISQPDAIWLMEPDAYAEALESYQGRKYEEAAKQFAKVRQDFIKLRELPNNYSSLAAFYEMEALRQSGKLDELKSKLVKFTPDDRATLTREFQKRQLEMYPMWEAIQEKAWARVEAIANEWLGKDLPGFQRAQAAYGLGLSLDGQDRTEEALDAYHAALVADTAASERIASEAALNALRLYSDDEQVQLAIRLHGTEDEDKNTLGARRLSEAGAVASLYELTLGAGQKLPAKFQELVKYTPSPMAVSKPELEKSAEKE